MIIIFIILSVISLTLLGRILKINSQSWLNPGPFWKFLYLEAFLIVFAPVILIAIPATQDVYQMRGVTEYGVLTNSLIFYFQLILFLFGVLVGIGKNYHIKEVKTENILWNSPVVFSVFLASVLLLLIVFSQVSTIPLFSFFTNSSSAVDRAIAGKELTGIYSIINTLSLTISWLLVYMAGELKLNKQSYLIFLIIGIFGLSWFGHKTSIILSIMGFYFYTIQNKKVNLFRALKIGAIMILMLLLLMYIYYSVIENKDNFWSEFLNRLFIGQLHGYYQEFEFFDSDKEYWKSWLPFSSFIFNENYHYAVDLMMYTEGASDTNQMKNTFLGAEAHRVLGLAGSLILMPALGYFVIKSVEITIDFLAKFLGKNIKLPLFWAFCSSLTITNGVYIYASFRFVYIFIVAMIPVIVVKCIIDFINIKKRNYE